MTNSYYVTTPIYYVNGNPHLGHAYTNIAADVSARFHRLLGEEIWFLTGTDEHGQKVALSASKHQKNPQNYVDGIIQQFYDFNKHLNISNNQFIRTTEKSHQLGAQALWNKVYKEGYIYKGTYKGYYSIRDEAYYTEQELSYGQKGELLAPTGAEVVFMEEKSYFFKLSAFQNKLLQYYDEHPEFIAPKARLHEIYQFVKSGLQDISISRSRFSWGIPVPLDGAPLNSAPLDSVLDEKLKKDQHVMYVWFDALSNYITALGYPALTPQFKTFWPANLQIVGKDIIRFHGVYWPAMLMAAELCLPKRIYAHGWWTVDGEKMSKSLGNVINPMELVHKFGSDYLRIYLLWGGSFADDKNFTYKGFESLINNKVVNEWGNLIHRTFSLLGKYTQSKIPEITSLSQEGKDILQSSEITQNLKDYIDNQEFSKTLDLIWKLVQQSNRYVDTMAPWGLSKNLKDPKLLTCLGVVCFMIYRIAVYLYPFMPLSSEKIIKLFPISTVHLKQKKASSWEDSLRQDSLREDSLWESSHWKDLSHIPITIPKILFTKIEDEQ